MDSKPAPTEPALSLKESITKFLKEAKPQLRNAHDAVAIALHIIMKAMQFRCVGIGEQQTDPNANETLVPTGWNQSSDAYALRYRHPQSSMTFLIKSLVMGDSLLVHGLAVEDKKIYNLELSVADYVKKDVALDDYENIYINIDNLISIFKNTILNKLLPMSPQDLQQAATTNAQSSTTAPVQGGRGRGYDPYAQDDYDPLRIPGSGGRGRAPPMYPPTGGFYPPPVQPFGIGDQDLFPQPFPRHPMAPSGNLIGPGHPGFGPFVNDPYGGGGPGQFFPGGRGRGGAPPSHPPGAHWDPYGPPPSNVGDPNPDELRPPSFDNDYFS